MATSDQGKTWSRFFLIPNEERSGRVVNTNTFIMKPKIDFCFKELMEFAEVRRGFIAAVLGISPEEVVSTELKPTHLRVKHQKDKQIGRAHV